MGGFVRMAAMAVLALAALSGPARRQAEAAGFAEHGVAAPAGMASWGPGIYAIETEDGTPTILVSAWTKANWGSTLLLVDARTGRTRQIDPGMDGYAMTTYLSSRGPLYTSFLDEFVEFDPNRAEITFREKIPPRYAASITEDDDGIIYAGLHPNNELLSLDPDARRLTSHGPLAQEGWRQYPHLVADAHGWVYVGVRFTQANLLAFHAKTGETRSLLGEEERAQIHRIQGFRGTDGKAYMRLGDGPWRELARGEARIVEKPPVEPAVTHLGWRDRTAFPNGWRLLDADVPNRIAVVGIPSGEEPSRFRLSASTQFPGWEAARAYDGGVSRSDGWSSDASGAAGQWLKVDMGVPHELTAFEMLTSRAWPVREFALQASQDGQTWRDVLEGTCERSSEWQTFALEGPSAARYWRIYVRSGYEERYVVIRELAFRDAEGRIANPRMETRTVAFDYESEGVPVFSLAEGPDGRIYGSTGAPLRFFRFDPAAKEFSDWGLGGHGGHLNDLAVLDGKVFGALYSCGSLLRYDPGQPWDDTAVSGSENPARVFHRGDAQDHFGRPYVLVAHPDGEHLAMAGHASRTYAGGGMLIYNARTGEATMLSRNQMVPDQATIALAALPGGNLVGGTSAGAATGGTAAEADGVVYLFDWESKSVAGHETAVPGESRVLDLLALSESRVIGITGGGKLFAYDPQAPQGERVRETVDMSEHGRPAGGPQGPRVLHRAPDGDVLVLFGRRIVRLNPDTLEHRIAARTPVPVGPGILASDGRLYFASGTRLWSVPLERLD